MVSRLSILERYFQEDLIWKYRSSTRFAEDFETIFALRKRLHT
jgi:hypothetical protein